MKRSARGFTLIEVLLATMLLATGLALAFATLRASTAMVGRGEVIAQRNERIRAVQHFLRIHLASALPVAFATDTGTLQQSSFIGEPQRMRFVADLPDYLGRGGPYLYDVGMDERSGKLQIAFAMVQAGNTVEERVTPQPELLAADLRSVRFRYRGLDDNNALGPWQTQWQAAGILPLQVAVDMQSDDGTQWPELVVTLARSEGGRGGGALAPGLQ
ncbi:prepilin-type N-terminal cleavage/methylation domain-containing protein [Pseudoxanthomonas wuyuanensis]|uniref:General secretion pathway protein J n=1 Tax=Pseudoxanthomonas wuyuanensis TaxID=1073196 RepID=A0A286DCA4_9GAMM|nr:prepilin-type N-terminal cleavage/methylation domain-containing protein [Pseudoxanthomonas wuyuanensis]KAF1717275.1 general secretion pathway protein GspJ [Pseudoxanthomonas wuyuanensis]SOD56239.1 general secretion pathway protein J [Pseudoxanthomonas wuyuanensis]